MCFLNGTIGYRLQDWCNQVIRNMKLTYAEWNLKILQKNNKTKHFMILCRCYVYIYVSINDIVYLDYRY